MTPYSRMGDGRAVLRSSVREYLAGEAMHGLGIPTTRALCLVASDDPVYRETVETAAIVTRMAPSFVRFGSFEHWSARRDLDRLATLADYVIDRYYPECRETRAGEPADPNASVTNLLREVTRRTALLMADWQSVGFCHGVMNTDNMSILGLTLDYGPYGFMDGFKLAHICNHSDTQGRYSWNRQPSVGLWNLYRLGGSLHSLTQDADALRAVLDEFEAVFTRAFHARMGAKLGLASWRPRTRRCWTTCSSSWMRTRPISRCAGAAWPMRCWGVAARSRTCSSIAPLRRHGWIACWRVRPPMAGRRRTRPRP